ncbi:MAG: ureidoglycolate lyase [Eubacteriales bacterium]|nr:ureidoglycolate lyase [Eubacteriales bacterium]
MKKTGIRRLSKESFEKYGSYASILEPSGEAFGEEPVLFYRDMVQQSLGYATNASYSTCVVSQRPWVITNSEVHDFCHETILCLDGDYLMHVAPATSEKQIPADRIEVFLIPKGTLVNVKAGVWHQAGFPYQCDRVHILCVLPERTYQRDCYCFDLPKKDQIEVSAELID